MRVEIDPIIVKKLDDFGRRRRNLIILRGLCSLIVSLLGVFTVIAVIDYFSQGHLPDQVRTGASGSRDRRPTAGPIPNSVEIQ